MNFTAKTASFTLKWTEGEDVDVKLFYKLRDAVSSEREMSIFLYDPDTTAFHQYEFEYDGSEKDVFKWTFNNVMWSLFNKDTKRNMADAFMDLKYAIDKELTQRLIKN